MLKVKSNPAADAGNTFAQPGINYLWVDDLPKYRYLDSAFKIVNGSRRARDLHSKVRYLPSQYPFFVVFTVVALFEQPRHQQRYARLIATRPHPAQSMFGVGVVGSVLLDVFGVLSAVESDWLSLGSFLAFFLISLSYMMGREPTGNSSPHPGYIPRRLALKGAFRAECG